MSLDFAAFEHSPHADLIATRLEWRYGITPQALSAYRFWQRPGGRTIWIAYKETTPPTGVDVQGFGLIAMRRPPPRGWMTNVFLRRFGHLATRSRYTLEPHALDRFVRGEAVPHGAQSSEDGPCVVQTRDGIVGRGRVRGDLLVPELHRSTRSPSAG